MECSYPVFQESQEYCLTWPTFHIGCQASLVMEARSAVSCLGALESTGDLVPAQNSVSIRLGRAPPYSSCDNFSFKSLWKLTMIQSNDYTYLLMEDILRASVGRGESRQI